MTAITHHTATLSFDIDTRLATDILGTLMSKALLGLDETGCTAPEPTLTGMRMSSDALDFEADIRRTADAMQLVLSLSGARLSASTVQAKLAGIVCHLATDLPVRTIDWLGTGTDLPREAFLAALAPQIDTPTPATVTAIAPRRVAASGRQQPRPDVPGHKRTLARMLPAVTAGLPGDSANQNARIGAERFDAHVRTYNANLRFCLLRDADVAELDAIRAETGTPPIEVRLSTWAVSLSVATISLPVAAPVLIYNLTRGEDMRVASLAMGIAGFFLALDTSGAMAGVLSTF